MHDTFSRLLGTGELDLVYTLNPHIEDDTLYLFHEEREQLSFYVCPEHELAGRKKVSEKDLDRSGFPFFSQVFMHKDIKLSKAAGELLDMIKQHSGK